MISGLASQAHPATALMTDKRWQEIEKLYHSVLARNRLRGRPFLKEACAGDEAMLRDVESLLAQQTEAESFIEAPALEVAAKGMTEDRSQSLIGRQLGSTGFFPRWVWEEWEKSTWLRPQARPHHCSEDPAHGACFRPRANAAVYPGGQGCLRLETPQCGHIHDIGESEGSTSLPWSM